MKGEIVTRTFKEATNCGSTRCYCSRCNSCFYSYHCFCYSSTPNQYVGTLPKCNKCNFHHTGVCREMNCRNYNRKGHTAYFCKAPAQPISQVFKSVAKPCTSRETAQRQGMLAVKEEFWQLATKKQ